MARQPMCTTVEATPSEDVALSRENTSAALDELDAKPEHPRKSRTAAAVPPTLQPPRQKVTPGRLATYAALVGLVVALSLSTVLGWVPSHWSAIVACLGTTLALLLGLDNLQPLLRAYSARPDASWMRIPLTDATYGQATLNKLANTAQVREKSLKILQYVLRGGAYCALFDKETSKHMKTLSKSTSIARRFFKFFRWVKHFEDLAEAKAEKGRVMQGLLYLRVTANFGADWAEDVCSLERIGLLPAGTLSLSFLLFAEFCQLVLAAVEVYVTTAKVRSEEDKTRVVEVEAAVKAASASAAAAASAPVVKQRRKLALTRMELCKYVSDIGKAIYDCELPFAHEGVFICCALFSALVSTHKNMAKVLK